MGKPTQQWTSSRSTLQDNREDEKTKPEPLPESLETSWNDLVCSQKNAWMHPEKSLAQIEGPINQWQATTDSFFGSIMEYLARLPHSFLISVASLLVLLVGILNHMAGPEISSTIFYLIPIVLVTWFTGRSIGFIFSILSALTWLIADLTSGTTHLNSDIPYWNAVARLGSFFILTFILSTLKNTLRQEKEFSRIDFLTGIRNRRYFIELLNMEINRAGRYDRPFTVVCLDLDNFKTVNDCFGHSTGDILLRLVARTIQQNIRVTDTVARLGGDEFAILLPETGRNVAEAILQKVQRINLDIMRRHGWPVTLSIGVVTFMSPPSAVDETLRISDQLMYSAKNSGKNSIQYEVFGERERPAEPAV
jgi:diguanylate cyclase (GGDEF)-like protein